MSEPNGDGGVTKTPMTATVAQKRAAATRARNSIARFQASGGFGGRMESVGGGAAGSPPSDEEIRTMAGSLAAAVQGDPVAFGVLGEMSGERQIRDQLASAVEAIYKDGQKADLTDLQRSALEAIVLLTGRPALFIKNDTFDLPTGVWELLAPFRADISTVAKSVGRVGVSMDYGTPYVGSGFVVASDLVMTNRHVIERFVAGTSGAWMLDPGCQMVVDFKQEFGVAEKAAFAVTGVVWVDERPAVDLALIKVDASSTRRLPAPLRLQSDAGFANEGNNVYVIGYPAADPTRNDANEMQRIFAGVYEKKRLAPGRIGAIDSGEGHLSHDCSTLGGNSGSCVVDLSTNSVVGLHFEGDYLVANRAVLLPALATDPNYRSLNWQVGRDTL